MGESIHHECGLAFLRLRRPLSWFREHHGDAAWGLRSLALLLQKQRNRGQDGAGVGVVRFEHGRGEPYLARARRAGPGNLDQLLAVISRGIDEVNDLSDTELDGAKRHSIAPFLGEVMLGHLRYGTHGGHSEDHCHPLYRRGDRRSRSLMLAGNFNMTNASALFDQLLRYGLDPIGESDTQIVLEKISHFLEVENRLIEHACGEGSLQNLSGRALASEIEHQIDLVRVLEKASTMWDGGWLFGGLLGHGDAFLCRDARGIRPGFVLERDSYVAAASERAALATVFNAPMDEIVELTPGEVLEIKRSGAIRREAYTPQQPPARCTFERIYFSRGNDPDIHRERLELGERLAPQVLKRLGDDVHNAVFSFVPNTAETAAEGLARAATKLVRQQHADQLWKDLSSGTAKREQLDAFVEPTIRVERLAHKDQRMRTFIASDATRRDLVLHVYDVTRDLVPSGSTLVMLDDSIVRGTTLRESIVAILDRLEPARILFVSSAPQIRYPDCYGIDMSQLGRFVAFRAAISLLEEHGKVELLEEVEVACREQLASDPHAPVNHVSKIYNAFDDVTIADRIATLLTPPSAKCKVEVLYQSVADLQATMPEHTGTWYFDGHYPTPGGQAVLHRAYLNWRRNSDERSY